GQPASPSADPLSGRPPSSVRSRTSDSVRLNTIPGGGPFRQAVGEVSRGVTVLTEGAGRFRRKGAVRTAAISHDLALTWQLPQPLLQLRKRNRNRAGNMRCLILLGGSDVDHHQRFARPESGQKLITADRF